MSLASQNPIRMSKAENGVSLSAKQVVSTDLRKSSNEISAFPNRAVVVRIPPDSDAGYDRPDSALTHNLFNSNIAHASYVERCKVIIVGSTFVDVRDVKEQILNQGSHLSIRGTFPAVRNEGQYSHGCLSRLHQCFHVPVKAR